MCPLKRQHDPISLAHAASLSHFIHFLELKSMSVEIKICFCCCSTQMPRTIEIWRNRKKNWICSMDSACFYGNRFMTRVKRVRRSMNDMQTNKSIEKVYFFRWNCACSINRNDIAGATGVEYSHKSIVLCWYDLKCVCVCARRLGLDSLRS